MTRRRFSRKGAQSWSTASDDGEPASVFVRPGRRAPAATQTPPRPVWPRQAGRCCGRNTAISAAAAAVHCRQRTSGSRRGRPPPDTTPQLSRSRTVASAAASTTASRPAWRRSTHPYELLLPSPPVAGQVGHLGVQAGPHTCTGANRPLLSKTTQFFVCRNQRQPPRPPPARGCGGSAERVHTATSQAADLTGIRCTCPPGSHRPRSTPPW